jgi:spermidine synthase
MPRRASTVAVLLFASGGCSLVYETVWMRELRLVFGASTMASGAVVACFLGGLGVGSLLLGPRADAHPRPLALYARFEAGIAASAAATPLLVWVARAIYLGLGGTRALGWAGASIARLVLSALIFAVPTVLMGGTLPAAARAIAREAGGGRRAFAVLYGTGTLGAVAGCLASTFVLPEIYGARLTLWIACLVNALVAFAARDLARRSPSLAAGTDGADGAEAGEARETREIPAWFALAGAAIVGFAFCLLELVWYRMLAPLLGGSVFTFGVVLAVALLGIGAGGVAYALRPPAAAATVHAFAWTCFVQAACIAAPYALGDHLALLAALLRPVGGLSFAAQVAAWSVIAGVVVLPAAFVSGAQLPLLVGLLGRGDGDVGRDVGRAYAANTAGAVAGSIAGGFGLIPALTAPGCWRLAAWLSFLLGAVAVTLAGSRRLGRTTAAVAVGLAAIALARAQGPTAAWRHSPIGAGRVDVERLRTRNDARAFEEDRRGAIAWEAEGRESSVALEVDMGLAFVINGKGDGNARYDAATAVMLGVTGALLHPHPQRAMVIGLGSGETAGWLAAIDTVTDVDVAELEPAVLEVARRCAIANHHALENPKVHVELGDARELLATSTARYDLIASEPSNPYRAGVASLFTRDYYETVASRLEEGGLFLQWVQGYEVDAATLDGVYATLASVFPEVETWELSSDDLLLIAAKRPIEHDVERIRLRLGQEAYGSAAAVSLRATDVEGFLSHFVATPALARAVARSGAAPVSTDDANFVERGFARSVGSGPASFHVADVRRAARSIGAHRPALTGGTVDWARVEDGVVDHHVAEETPPPEDPPGLPPERAHRAASLRAFAAGDLRRAVAEWRGQPQEPAGPTPRAALASALAGLGDPEALRYADAIRAFDPAEADAILARLRWRQGRASEAVDALEAFFLRLRADPWPMLRLVSSAIDEAREITTAEARFAPRLYAALREPFALRVFDNARKRAALEAALRNPDVPCADAFALFEPHVPWEEEVLRRRLACYRDAGPPAAAESAERDVREWLANRPAPFGASLSAEP